MQESRFLLLTTYSGTRAALKAFGERFGGSGEGGERCHSDGDCGMSGDLGTLLAVVRIPVARPEKNHHVERCLMLVAPISLMPRYLSSV